MLATILTALFSSSSFHYHSAPNKPNHKRSKRNQVRLSFSMICCSSSSSSSIAILSTASRIDGTVSRTRTRNSLSLLSHSFHLQVNVNGNHQLFIRRRISRWCRVSPNASSSLELPLLPFNTNEVLTTYFHYPLSVYFSFC
jgi:hypothetical protein